jgi:hypothetical protein
MMRNCDSTVYSYILESGIIPSFSDGDESEHQARKSCFAPLKSMASLEKDI